MGPAGFEPAANGLKGRCSTAELRALAGGARSANPRARGARERAMPGWAGGSVCQWVGLKSTQQRFEEGPRIDAALGAIGPGAEVGDGHVDAAGQGFQVGLGLGRKLAVIGDAAGRGPALEALHLGLEVAPVGGDSTCGREQVAFAL